MAQFTHSLCEEVIRTGGKCGLTRNEMVQLANIALRVLKLGTPLSAVERELALANARIDYLMSPDSSSPEGSDTVAVPRLLLLSMGTDHIVRGGPGPLFGAGWAAACEHWSRKLLALNEASMNKEQP